MVIFWPAETIQKEKYKTCSLLDVITAKEKNKVFMPTALSFLLDRCPQACSVMVDSTVIILK
jgi:hypothetical protein